MDNMLQKIIDFIKKETVLTIATVLAVASAFWVHPGPQYVGYIDWRVLGILLSLMLIVAGFQSNGLFDAIGSRLLAKTQNTAQLMPTASSLPATRLCRTDRTASIFPILPMKMKKLINVNSRQ